jgi:hypothetical protein
VPVSPRPRLRHQAAVGKAQAERALDAGLAPARGTGDEVYGRSSELRGVFEARGIGYTFAVGCDFQVTTSGYAQMRADRTVGLVEARGWNRRSAGAGSKGLSPTAVLSPYWRLISLQRENFALNKPQLSAG